VRVPDWRVVHWNWAGHNDHNIKALSQHAEREREEFICSHLPALQVRRSVEHGGNNSAGAAEQAEPEETVKKNLTDWVTDCLRAGVIL
jgi:hypothetical protein